MRQSPFQRLSSILNNQLGQRYDPVTRSAEIEKLQQAWRLIVPHPAAQHTHLIHYDAGRLVVGTDSSVWATALRHQAPSILHSLRAHGHPGICELVIRVCPRETPPPAKPPQSRAPLSSEIAQLLGNAAESIHDPALKSTLKRLSRLSKAQPPKSTIRGSELGSRDND